MYILKNKLEMPERLPSSLQGLHQGIEERSEAGPQVLAVGEHESREGEEQKQHRSAKGQQESGGQRLGFGYGNSEDQIRMRFMDQVNRSGITQSQAWEAEEVEMLMTK